MLISFFFFSFLDIDRLHEIFKKKYKNSEDFLIAQLRDIPPVSGAIIWAKQLERQLDMYLQRVEDVLGSGWELDPEGQKLRSEGDSFRKKLATDQIFEEWVRETEHRSFNIAGEILTIVKKGQKFYLDINFDPQMISLFKEVRNLQVLGFRIPLKISMLATNAKQLYPYSVSIRETLRTYTQTTSRITPDIAPLVAIYKRDVQKQIETGFKLNWEAVTKLEPFAKRFSEVCTAFADKVDLVLKKSEKIQQELSQLTTCPLQEKQFATILNNVQQIVDELNLGSYSNLPFWVEQIDSKVEAILSKRLTECLQTWINVFAPPSANAQGSAQSNDQNKQSRQKESTPSKSGNKDAAVTATTPAVAVVQGPTLPTSVHEIIIRNQIMFLDPPLEHARVNWIGELHNWLGIICNQTRLQSSRYDEGLAASQQSQQVRNFKDLLSKLPNGMLDRAYDTLESKLREIEQYVKIWLQYQALWDMEPNAIYSQLGADLERWQQLLNEIKRARSTFDTRSTSKAFGPIVIDYQQVQASVNNKYDYWHKDVISSFGAKLNESMKAFHSKIATSRTELERLSVETVSTAEAVGFTIQIQELKKELPAWERELKSLHSGQELLNRQRFQFPSDWLEYEMVEGEWNAFNEILARKSDALASQIPELQKKILDEEQAVIGRIKDLVSEWTTAKPVGGTQKFSAALDTLKLFEGRVARLQSEQDRIRRAREALSMDAKPNLGAELGPIDEEIKDLFSVWNELASTWNQIDAMKETAWTAIVPRKIRQQLEDVLNALKNLPNRTRQYQAFQHVQNVIKIYLKYNGLIIDLRSEALRERHWKDIRKRLNANWTYAELTLGNIWDSDLQKHETLFKEVVAQAQGEMALEEFLRSVREFWQTFQLDLVTYQNKTRLIRGWDDLFAKLGEHLNSLSAMKMSPYYKVFEEESTTWEDRLSRVREVFDIWIDVQRRWVYLEGIFSGSSDINSLLPTESQRFKTINAEFVNLMKKVSSTPLILEVLAFEGLQRTMDRLLDQLTKIQKALGEYLERQRTAFPRFYFVGDEDLLEIIGNSKDLGRIQKHLKKMFAGLSGLQLDAEKITITGINSAEGEVVPFVNPISLKNGPKINEWLTSVEREMKVTLATVFQQAIADYEKLPQPVETNNGTAFLEFLDKYPAQIDLLVIQVSWSKLVEKALGSNTPLDPVLASVESALNLLASNIMGDLPAIRRKKYEHLITELVHHRDVTRRLIKKKLKDAKDFEWLNEMRYYWNPAEAEVINRLVCQMANAKFIYGFEYLGVGEKLVQTPLTDRCYLALTQALESRLGGNPFGPAGTGKTETVKALGGALGKYVIVFCCDESFDFQAMGRIFVGLCMCGAWGCFDEFNRLEERILSAVSQQIQQIQIALKNKTDKVRIDRLLFLLFYFNFFVIISSFRLNCLENQSNWQKKPEFSSP